MSLRLGLDLLSFPNKKLIATLILKEVEFFFQFSSRPVRLVLMLQTRRIWTRVFACAPSISLGQPSAHVAVQLFRFVH